MSTKSDDSWIFLNSLLTFILQHKQNKTFAIMNPIQLCFDFVYNIHNQIVWNESLTTQIYIGK